MGQDPNRLSNAVEEWAEIEGDLAAARERARHSWRWYRARRAALAGREDARVDIRRLETSWQRARDRFLAEINALNHRIEAHNRTISPGQRPWPRLNPESELRRLGIDETRPAREATADTSERPPARTAIAPASPAEIALHQLITIREKIPHTPRWERARKRALWRYLARLQSQHDKE